MIIKIPGLDVEKALDLYDDDIDLYLAVLRSYAANTPAALDRMRNVSADTLGDYTAAAHGVKGTSTNIGAEETRASGLKLEMMGKAGDLSGILAMNETFIQHVEDLLKNINSWLKEYDAKGR